MKAPVALLLLAGCAKPVDRGPEIESLKTQIAKLQTDMKATQADLKKETDAIIDGMNASGLVDKDGKEVVRWWCEVNSACLRSKETCDLNQKTTNARTGYKGVDPGCAPTRVAYCPIGPGQCWMLLADCQQDAGGPEKCRGVE